MKVLEGEKVVLRAVEPADIDLLMQWENDRSHWEITGTIAPYSRSILEDYIRHAHLDIYKTGQQRLMMESRICGSTVGTIDLFDFDPFHQRAGIGILIGDPEKRNNGIGREALALVKEYCFKFLGIKTLFCNILEENHPSLQLFEKEGFKVTGKKLAWVRSGDEFKDEYFLQLLKDE
jgi:diamine N-acetyltransferase